MPDKEPVSLLELYRTEANLLQAKISQMLVIRGWAITLALGLVVAILQTRNAIIGFGGFALLVFWYQDVVYERFRRVVQYREQVFRWALANALPEHLRLAYTSEATYIQGLPGNLAYLVLLALVWGSSLYVAALH